MSSRFIRISLHVLSWSALLISLVSIFANLDEYRLSMFFSSDSVGLPCTFKDLDEDGGHLKDWCFAASPTIFPDVVLFYLMQKAGHFNVISAAFVYGVLQVLLLVILLTYVFKRTVPEYLKPYSWLVPALFSTFCLECYYFSHDFFPTILLLEYQYHVGSFINALLALSVFLSPLRNSYKYSLLLLVSFLGMFSDMLYVVMFGGPFLFTMLIIINRKKLKHNTILSLFAIAGIGLGYWFYKYIQTSQIAQFTPPYSNVMSAESMKSSLNMFYNQVVGYIMWPGFRSALVAGTFISIPFTFILAFVKRKKLPDASFFFLIYFTVFSLALFVAPVISGNYVDSSNLRYSLSPFLLFIVPLSWLMAWLMEKIKAQAIRAAFKVVVPSVFLIMALFGFSSRGLGYYFNYYPPKVAEIDNLCKKYNLKNGISDYWNAKWSTMLSKNKIRIVSVFSDAHIYNLGANNNWYYKNTFDFIVDERMDSAAVKRYFTIKDTVSEGSTRLLLVEPFTYVPGTYDPVPLSFKK